MDYRMTYLRLAATTVAALLVLVACSDSQQFPSPTGKGSFRGINAISTSPELAFRIEETTRGGIAYGTVSRTTRIDDFEYNFNFDTFLPGDEERTRVATVRQKIDANKDYTFVATGSTASASVITWITDERTFEEGATVAQIQLAHLADSLGEVDVYFSVEGTTPMLGEERGTYSFGEILPAFDIEPANYTLTVTAPDDPGSVLYESPLAGYVASTALIVAIFDGTVDDTSAITARTLEAGVGTDIGTGTGTGTGAVRRLPDARSGSTVRFVQGSEFLGTTDIYDDEGLTNRIVEALPFAGFSDEVERAQGETVLRYTPAGSTETILLEGQISLVQGRRYDYYTFGTSDALFAVGVTRNRQPVDVYAQVGVTNLLVGEENEDLFGYLLAPGETLADRALPDFSAAYGLPGPNLGVTAGTYDLVFTRSIEDTTPIADPIPLSLSNGDVERFVIFPTPDPNVVDIKPQP